MTSTFKSKYVKCTCSFDFRGIIYRTQLGNETKTSFYENTDHIVDGMTIDTDLGFLFWSAITDSDGKQSNIAQNAVKTFHDVTQCFCFDFVDQ